MTKHEYDVKYDEKYSPMNERFNTMWENKKENKTHFNPRPSISKVIFNGPATIIIWNDGVKTVVKANGSDLENFDYEKGISMAIAKRYFGNVGHYYENIKKWIPKEEPAESIDAAELLDFIAKKFNEGLGEGLGFYKSKSEDN